MALPEPMLIYVILQHSHYSKVKRNAQDMLVTKMFKNINITDKLISKSAYLKCNIWAMEVQDRLGH